MFSRPLRDLALAGVFFAPVMVHAQPARETPTKQVLLLLATPLYWPVSSQALSTLQTVLSRKYPPGAFVTAETVAPDAWNLPYPDRTPPWFREKYRDRKFDVIVALRAPAVRRALELRKELWPGVPAVALMSSEGDNMAPGERGLAKVIYPGPVAFVTAGALALMPGTRHIAFVGGAGALDRSNNEAYLRVFKKIHPTMDVIDLTGLPMSAIQSRVANLPADTCVIVGSLIFDANGRQFTPAEPIALLEPFSRGPIFIGHDAGLGKGALGGPMIHNERAVEEIAGLTARVLAGENPDSIAPIASGSVAYQYDWRQLRKWNVPDSRIPKGARVLFRDVSVFERYRGVILAGGGVLILQALLITGLLVERRRRKLWQKELADRLVSEKLVADISASLNGVELDQVASLVIRALERIALAIGTGTASLRVVRPNGQVRLLRWKSPAVTMDPDLTLDRIPYMVAEARSLRPLIVERIDDLSQTAPVDYASLRGFGVRSVLSIPVQLKDSILGVVTLATFGHTCRWNSEWVARVSILAEILCNAVARHEAELAMRESEALRRAVMASMAGYVVIADRNGDVIGANHGHASIGDAWRPAHFPQVSLHQDYLHAWSHGCYCGGDESPRVTHAIREVLSGVRESAILECRFRTAYGDHWLEIHAQRLDHPAGGAVITHFDITGRKRTELEAARNLGEISHLNRVGAMGEMAASLAHEINQPLAAIIANGEAASVLLDQRPANLEEVRAALSDIVNDGRRAGDVIRNMRSLLRKSSMGRSLIDLNAVAAETVRLVRHSALLARVHIKHEPAAAAPAVMADPVQLQQVMLNLLSNAIEALSAVAEERRRVVVRTVALKAPYGVRLDVEDSGPGIPASRRATVFQPFFTTKPGGLGVGLSVSRSIVESHDGRIWVDASEDGGATFRFFLPAAQ